MRLEGGVSAIPGAGPGRVGGVAGGADWPAQRRQAAAGEWGAQSATRFGHGCASSVLCPGPADTMGVGPGPVRVRGAGGLCEGAGLPIPTTGVPNPAGSPGEVSWGPPTRDNPRETPDVNPGGKVTLAANLPP